MIISNPFLATNCGGTEEINALVIYGGGLCDSAAFSLSEFAQNLSRKNWFNHVYVGFYSFRSLLCSKFIKEWSDDEYIKTVCVKGGYFGTARETDLTEPGLIEHAIEVCKEKNIKWIFLGGGDGSARQMAEIRKRFEEAGIYFVFFMANTIDGIEGGYSIGLKSAVAVSIDRIKNVASTCLRTLDGNKFPAVVVVLQGRNRDDILANVMYILDQMETIGDFKKEEIELIAIPANGYKWQKRQHVKDRLFLGVDPVSEFEVYGKPKLIIMSEGADFPTDEEVLKSITGVKTRVNVVAHESQVNGLTTCEEESEIITIIAKTMEILQDALSKEMSFTIVTEKNVYGSFSCRTEGPDYFAMNNPRAGQNPTLDSKLWAAIEKYLP
ncbi:MAG: 6-phosphofructokinase [Clostridia bacterium]|nr:6-phosphofructokinase [Clostridia bacterium]